MSVLVFALTTVNQDNPEALGLYLATTAPLLERAGAEILQRYEVKEAVVGEPPAEFVTIVRYPDRSAVDTVFQSSEYHALREIRRQAFSTYQINIVQE